MHIPFINVCGADIPSEIKEKMQSLQSNDIACVNWPKAYPSRPKVSFRIAHNGSHLFLWYSVEENEILAKTTEDNGPVWTDSCVEFFVSFDDLRSYYNAEFNCAGKALLRYKPKSSDPVPRTFDIMNQIKRYPSLGAKPFDKKQGDFHWDLLVAIPVAAYRESGISSFSGMKARGNFYKCGDDLTVPHFLSWTPIDTENPSFHEPQFFGELYFE